MCNQTNSKHKNTIYIYHIIYMCVWYTLSQGHLFLQIKDYKCDDCGKCYTYKKNLKQHLESAHGDTGSRKKCLTCDKIISANNFARHQDIHGPPKYICSRCHKSFKDKTNYMRNANSCKTKSKFLVIVSFWQQFCHWLQRKLFKW